MKIKKNWKQKFGNNKNYKYLVIDITFKYLIIRKHLLTAYPYMVLS